MKTFCLILSISLLIFFTSCNSLYKLTPGYWKMKSEFKKELEFVEKILDKPDKIQEIIETSEFYDINEFNMCGFSYQAFINYFKSINKSKVSMTITIGNSTHNENKVNDCKFIDIREGDEQLSPSFTFKEIDGKIILLDLCFVAN